MQTTLRTCEHSPKPMRRTRRMERRTHTHTRIELTESWRMAKWENVFKLTSEIDTKSAQKQWKSGAGTTHLHFIACTACTMEMTATEFETKGNLIR